MKKKDITALASVVLFLTAAVIIEAAPVVSALLIAIMTLTAALGGWITSGRCDDEAD